MNFKFFCISPLAFLPRTRSTKSTCTLCSAWEIWNSYRNCSAWLDRDTDETSDCPYPGSISSSFWGILRIFILPLCSHTCHRLCLCIHFLQVRSACFVYSLCACVGGEPVGRVPSKSDGRAWLMFSLVARELLLISMSAARSEATSTCHYFSSPDIQAF